MEEAGVSWGHALFSQLSAPVVAEWCALSTDAFKAGFMGKPSAELMPVPHGILSETLFCLSNSQPDLLVYCLRLILLVVSGKNCLRLPIVSNDLFRSSLKSIPAFEALSGACPRNTQVREEPDNLCIL